MTKLTKEQIEQERVKFELWAINFFPNSFSIEIIKTSYHARIGYTNYIVSCAWQTWLTRAELAKGEW